MTKQSELTLLEQKYFKGLWEYKDGERYGFLLTGNPCIWLSPESYLSY